MRTASFFTLRLSGVNASGTPRVLPLTRLLAVVTVAVVLSACSRLGERQQELDVDTMPVTALYQEAKTALNGRDWTEAITLYQKLQTRFPYGQFSEQAQLELAYAYFKNNRAPLATATLQRFLEAHPTHPNADYAYYLTGLIAFDEDASWLGKLNGRADLSDRDPQAARNAIDAFETMLNRFPESRYANDARRRVLYIGTALARHELHVAEYYLRREAYVAVINRARNIVENYGRTPTVEDALGIMAVAYKELDMEELASDTVRVLSLNFPDSPHLDYVAEADPGRRYTPVTGPGELERAENKNERPWFSWFRRRPPSEPTLTGG